MILSFTPTSESIGCAVGMELNAAINEEEHAETVWGLGQFCLSDS